MQEARNKHEQPRDDDQLAALFTDEVRHRTAFSWPPLRVSHSRHSQPCRTNDDRPLRLAPSTKPKAYQVAATDEAPPRLVYLVRHAEAGKTLGAVPGEDAFDRLTTRGVGQAAELGALLHSREGCCAAVLSAGERRCQQTAAAIASALGVPAAEVRTDGALTCCLPGVSETPAQRAARGLRAVEAFLEATRGDVVVVSHGTLISLMLHSADLAADTTVRHRVCTSGPAWKYFSWPRPPAAPTDALFGGARGHSGGCDGAAGGGRRRERRSSWCGRDCTTVTRASGFDPCN